MGGGSHLAFAPHLPFQFLVSTDTTENDWLAATNTPPRRSNEDVTQERAPQVSSVSFVFLSSN
jgi:hypothetical protein